MTAVAKQCLWPSEEDFKTRCVVLKKRYGNYVPTPLHLWFRLVRKSFPHIC